MQSRTTNAAANECGEPTNEPTAKPNHTTATTPASATGVGQRPNGRERQPGEPNRRNDVGQPTDRQGRKGHTELRETAIDDAVRPARYQRELHHAGYQVRASHDGRSDRRREHR